MADNINQVVIPFNKSKLWGMALCCAVFILLGFLFVLTPYHFKSPLIHSLTIIRILGFIALALFGYFLGLYIPRLTAGEPGLVVDEQGITDNTTHAAPGLIPWKDIVAIHPQKITGQKFMVIKVSDPQIYIEKAKGIEARSLKGNLQLCGSPVVISAAALKCNFKTLENILTEAFEKYKKTPS